MRYSIDIYQSNNHCMVGGFLAVLHSRPVHEIKGPWSRWLCIKEQVKDVPVPHKLIKALRIASTTLDSIWRVLGGLLSL